MSSRDNSFHTFSRRRLLAAVPGLLILAACGGDDDDDDSTSVPAATNSPAAAAPSATTASATNTPAASSAGTPTIATSPVATSATTGEWSFTDDRGEIITLAKMPERIVAQTTSAAALWDLGVRPVAIYGPGRLEDNSPDFAAGDIDLEAVEYLGDYGEMDLEKLVALQADLYVDLTWGGAFWYLPEELRAQVEEIVPTLGISMERVSVLESIGRFEELSAALGADLTAPEIVEAKAAFTEAEDALKAAIAEKPGLTVLVISGSLEQAYIASSEWMTDLHYFRDLGLDVIDHGTDDFFELLSWEQVNKYPADLVLVDARDGNLQPEQLAEIATWNTLPAVQVGQVGPWYANAPYSYKRLVPIIEEMTAIIRESRADVV